MMSPAKTTGASQDTGKPKKSGQIFGPKTETRDSINELNSFSGSSESPKPRALSNPPSQQVDPELDKIYQAVLERIKNPHLSDDDPVRQLLPLSLNIGFSALQLLSTERALYGDKYNPQKVSDDLVDYLNKELFPRFLKERTVGGTETPTAWDVDNANQRLSDEELANRERILGRALADLRAAAAASKSELLQKNVTAAINATELGLAIWTRVVDAAPEPNVAQEAKDDLAEVLADFAPALTKKQRDEILTEARSEKGPPLPKLTSKQITAIKRRAKARPWSERPNVRMSAFEWVRDNYSEWIPGLLQHHLKFDSAQLYHSFAQRLSREGGLPEGLDVPTEGEAELRAALNPLERAKILAVRRLGRERSRIARALHL